MELPNKVIGEMFDNIISAINMSDKQFNCTVKYYSSYVWDPPIMSISGGVLQGNDFCREIEVEYTPTLFEIKFKVRDPAMVVNLMCNNDYTITTQTIDLSDPNCFNKVANAICLLIERANAARMMSNIKHAIEKQGMDIMRNKL